MLEEEEFRQQPRAAIALQAYLRDAEHDVRELIRWARRRQRRIGVRLVKGAYWDSEIAWAKQKNWPIPVYLDKAETDANYERLSRCCWKIMMLIDRCFRQPQLCVVSPMRSSRPSMLGVPPTAMKYKCSTAWPNRFAGRSSKTASGSGFIFRSASCCRECLI